MGRCVTPALWGQAAIVPVSVDRCLVPATFVDGAVAADSSALYARNVLDFLKLVCPKDATAVQVPMDDDIVVACLMAQGGQLKRA